MKIFNVRLDDSLIELLEQLMLTGGHNSYSDAIRNSILVYATEKLGHDAVKDILFKNYSV